jgi:hypothetical protein
MDKGAITQVLPHVFFVLLVGVLIVLVVLPYWKIFSKAGFPGWISISQLIPVLNIIILYYVAYSKWKTPQNSS